MFENDEIIIKIANVLFVTEVGKCVVIVNVVYFNVFYVFLEIIYRERSIYILTTLRVMENSENGSV